MRKILITFTLFFLGLYLSGCTLHFKATDVELDTEANRTYHLEKIDLIKNSRT